MANEYGKKLLRGYRMAGPEFLGEDIEGMFRTIKTPEDIALHNMIQQKVLAMVGGPKPKFFFMELARKTMEMKIKPYARMVAETILETSKG